MAVKEMVVKVPPPSKNSTDAAVPRRLPLFLVLPWLPISAVLIQMPVNVLICRANCDRNVATWLLPCYRVLLEDILDTQQATILDKDGKWSAMPSWRALWMEWNVLTLTEERERRRWRMNGCIWGDHAGQLYTSQGVLQDMHCAGLNLSPLLL